MRLIDADAVIEKLYDDTNHNPFHAPFKLCTADRSDVNFLLHGEPTINAVPVPCKIGDLVYGIRDYKGVPNVQKGFVSEMFFTKDMKLMIVIKYVCRGYWLDKVFPTYEAAEAAIREKGE